MKTADDRYHRLMLHEDLNGIDFVYVHPDQLHLDIYFLKPPVEFYKPKATIKPGKIRIYSDAQEGLPDIKVASVIWVRSKKDTIPVKPIKGAGLLQPLKPQKEEKPDVLRLTTEIRGGYGWYRLFIDDLRIDPGYNNVRFSFKANCPSDLDCKPGTHECPREAPVDFPIDYLARDFWSFRQALMDFASLRYPDWKDRLEADAGVMLAEVMSALGDEMAYYQDRIAREAYLGTATQRRSARRHARLIDHHIHDGLGATSWIDVTVNAAGSIPAGMDIWATDEQGNQIHYEVGNCLAEVINKIEYNVDQKSNVFEPYIWDENNACLPVGCVKISIKGYHEGDLKTFNNQYPDANNGKWVLLQSKPTDTAIPARAFMLRLIKVDNDIDLLSGEKITNLEWDPAQGLPYEMCLKNNVTIRGNLLPVSAGHTYEKLFIIGVEPSEEQKKKMERAIEREGHDSTVAYLFSLTESEIKPLVWLGSDPRKASPEIHLVEMEVQNDTLVEKTDGLWYFKRSPVGSNSSMPDDRDFFLDDGIWKRVVGYQRDGTEVIHTDYATDKGVTVRFGDGEFGLIPVEGTIFKVIYRLGGTRQSNVPASSLVHFDPPMDFIDKVSNPLPATNGMDAESLDEVRKLAPEIYKSITFRAVRPEDYAEAAERLEWVQKAGATFRWTGSWLSAFVTPDPRSSVELTASERVDLARQLDRFRQAGRQVHVLKPVYADIDLEITVCVKPESFRGEVKQKIMEKLLGKQGNNPSTGFFSPDNFTFGTLLERSALEATIQSVPGVKTILSVEYKRRGWFDKKIFTDYSYNPGLNTIIRVANDPLHPARGTVKLYMKGGA